MSALPQSKHVRPGFCCLGMLYSCGHSSDCMYDEGWKKAHDKLHANDWWSEAFFWASVCIALFVGAFTR